MSVVARRREGYAHDVEIEGGHTLVIDEPVTTAGRTQAPPPPARSAASLAACTAITVEMYADRKGWDVGALEVEVEIDYDGPVTDVVRRHPPLSRRPRRRADRAPAQSSPASAPSTAAHAGDDGDRDGSHRPPLSVNLGPRRQGLRRHRRQPGHRARRREAPLRGGRLGPAGRARRGGPRRGRRGREQAGGRGGRPRPGRHGRGRGRPDRRRRRSPSSGSSTSSSTTPARRSGARSTTCPTRTGRPRGS